MDISLQLSMHLLIPFGYPLISIDIHAWTCYGFSIQGEKTQSFLSEVFAASSGVVTS